MATTQQDTNSIHTLDTLRSALKGTPANVKSIFEAINAKIAQVKQDMPFWLKNCAKVIFVIREEHAKLAKKKALGLQSTLTVKEYVETWLGGKPNKRMTQLSVALSIPGITETVWDQRPVGMLTTLARIKDMSASGDYTMKDALAQAKAKVISNDPKGLQAIVERCVESDSKLFTFISEAEHKTKAESKARESAVGVSHLLTPSQSMAAANASLEKIDEAEKARVLEHAMSIIAKLGRMPVGNPAVPSNAAATTTPEVSTADLQDLQKSLSNTVAA